MDFRSKLRGIKSQYGLAGTLFACAFVLGSLLWQRHRTRLLVTLVLILTVLSGFLVGRAPARHSVRKVAAPLPVTGTAPVRLSPLSFPRVQSKNTMPDGRVAFERNGWIYVASLSKDGRLLQPAQKLTATPIGNRGPELAWSGDGRRLAFSDPVSNSLYVLEIRSGAKPVCLGRGEDPAFSPSADQLAYVHAGPEQSDVYVRDLVSGKEMLLRSNASKPCWSQYGRQIMVCDESDGQLNGPPLLIDSLSGNLIATLEGIGGQQPLLSPDDKYVANCASLSRPKLSPTILCLATRKLMMVPHEGDPDLAWSPDSRWLGWGRWIVDPNNDGSYISLEVWITSPSDGTSRKVGKGCCPRFAPDGNHLLYVQTSNYIKRGQLMVADLNGRHCHRLADQVSDSIAVWIRPK